MEVIISTWRMGASILRLILISSTWDYTTFHSFFSMLKKEFQNLAGLWLVGELVDHVGIYGSKVAEGFSAFPTSVLYDIVTKRAFRVFSRILNCHIITTNKVEFRSVEFLYHSTTLNHVRWILDSGLDIGNQMDGCYLQFSTKQQLETPSGML